MNPFRWLKKECLLRKSYRLARRGQAEAALQAIEQAAVLAPRSVDVAIQQAWALADLRRYDEALQIVESGLEKNRKSGVFHMIRGEIHFGRREYEAARQSLHQALELSGENLRVEYDLGLTYLALGDFDRAGQFFESTVRYDKSLVHSRLLAMAEHYLMEHAPKPVPPDSAA